MNEYLRTTPRAASVAEGAADGVEVDGGEWEPNFVAIAGGIAVVLLLAYLVYADTDSSAGDGSDDEDTGQNTDAAEEPASGSSSAFDSGQSSGGLVQA